MTQVQENNRGSASICSRILARGIALQSCIDLVVGADYSRRLEVQENHNTIIRINLMYALFVLEDTFLMNQTRD